MKLVAGIIIGATLGALARRLVGLAVGAVVLGLATGKVDHVGPVSVDGSGVIERVQSVRWNGKRVDPEDVARALTTAAASAGEKATGGLSGGTDGKLVRVVDGDTVDVMVKGKKERVRVLGINTPEVYGGAECFGPQASKNAKAWGARHSTVRLRRDDAAPNRDRYQRLLRYVEPTGDGRDLSTVQVAGGYARVAAYGQKLDRLSTLDRAQRRARAASRGLWGAC
jgi:micrococcal nuclease